VSYVIYVRTCFKHSDAVTRLRFKMRESAYTIAELSHQIIMVRPPSIAMHSSRLGTALAAGQAASSSSEHVVS